MSAAFVIEFAFIFSVLIAGSNAQSVNDEIFDVVAIGMPLRSTSVPPAVVNVALSNVIMFVVTEEIYPITDEILLVVIVDEESVVVLMVFTSIMDPPAMERVLLFMFTVATAGNNDQFTASLVRSPASLK
jgi:hypothetical protein